MIKLLSRVPYNLFYALDLVLSALTFGAKGETLSARIWNASLQTQWYYRLPAKVLRLAVDGIALLVFGEKGHCLGAYNAYVAAKPAA